MELDPLPPEDCLEQLRARVQQLETALETRLDIELAKGFLMAKHGLTEDEAYLALRRLARSLHRDLHQVSQEVVDGRLRLE